MNDLVKWGLLGVGGYLFYQRFVAAPAPAVAATPTGSAGGTTGTTAAAAGSFSISDLINALKGATPVPPGPQVCPPGYTGTYPSCVAPVAPPPPAPPAVPKIGKYPYTDKASYQAALVSAVLDAAGGDPSAKHTADEWNWYMTNTVGVNYAPDPTNAMAPGQRYTPITAGVYYDALRFQGLLDYPTGLSGFGFGASSGTPFRIPVPLMARRVKALPVPPIAVIHLGNGRTALVRMGGN